MLPSYTSKQQDDQDPLLPTTAEEGRISTDTAPPTYPPTGSSVQGKHNVEYSYAPYYPRKGKTEHAVGVLGNTKHETIQIVQKGIQGLSTINPDRMVFKIPIGTGDDRRWAKVLDEAWDRFDANPPERLAIVVSDLPGDENLRARRSNRHLFWAIMILVGLILCGIALYQWLESGTKNKVE